MPNAKVLEQKQKLVAELSEKIGKAITGVIVNYEGTSVADDTALRKELRANGVEYFVVEQDKCDVSALESIKISADYLKNV